MRDFEPRPLPVPPLEGVKFLFSIAIYSVTRIDIATVLSLLGTRLGSLYSAPGAGALGLRIWGLGPPTQISPSGTLRFFAAAEIRPTLRICRPW